VLSNLDVDPSTEVVVGEFELSVELCEDVRGRFEAKVEVSLSVMLSIVDVSATVVLWAKLILCVLLCVEDSSLELPVLVSSVDVKIALVLLLSNVDSDVVLWATLKFSVVL